jgi:hypothetical protein
VIAEVIERFREVVTSERGRLEVGWRVEWCALPGVRREFEVRVELGRMGKGVEMARREMDRLERWIDGQWERFCVMANLETARGKMEEVFASLERGAMRATAMAE